MDILKSATLEYDQIVIGGSIEALLYSYTHSLPIVCDRSVVPRPFDFLPFSINTYESFNVEDVKNYLNTNKGRLEKGNRAVHIYDRLYFVLAAAGLNPFAGQGSFSIRIANEHQINVLVGQWCLIKVLFNTAIIFPGTNVEGLSIKSTPRQHKLRVIDWMDVRSCGPHYLDLLLAPREKFVREVYFYPSVRVDGSSNGKVKDRVHKDLVAVSYLNLSQSGKEEFSEIYAKFAVLSMMKEAQIKGNVKEYTATDVIYRPIKIELDSREIEHLSFPSYEAPSNISFCADSFEELFAKFDPRNSSLLSLNQRLFPELKAYKWKYLKYQM